MEGPNVVLFMWKVGNTGGGDAREPRLVSAMSQCQLYSCLLDVRQNAKVARTRPGQNCWLTKKSDQGGL